MIKIELKNVNTNKIHDELIVGGITPILVESSENITWVTINDFDEIKAREIITKHNPIPIELPKSELEILKEKTILQDGAIMELAEIISTLGGV